MNEEQDPERRRHFLVKLLFANSQYQHVTCLLFNCYSSFYYLIDIDPVFRMLTDETETLLLKEDVWDACVNNFMRKIKKNFTN